MSYKMSETFSNRIILWWPCHSSNSRYLRTARISAPTGHFNLITSNGIGNTTWYQTIFKLTVSNWLLPQGMPTWVKHSSFNFALGILYQPIANQLFCQLRDYKIIQTQLTHSFLTVWYASQPVDTNQYHLTAFGHTLRDESSQIIVGHNGYADPEFHRQHPSWCILQCSHWYYYPWFAQLQHHQSHLSPLIV